MARYFNNAVDKITLGSAVATVPPITLACWGKLDTLQPTDTLYHHFLGVMKVSGGGTDNGFYMGVDNRVSAGARRGLLTCVTVAASTFGLSNGAQAPSGWFHAAGVFASTANRLTYTNGVAGTADLSLRNTSDINDTMIGIYSSGSGAIQGNVGHQIAECAIWNAALDAAEIAALARGYSPSLIRPASLVFYAPLIRDAVSRKGGSLTVTGTTVADHPRIILPRRRAA